MLLSLGSFHTSLSRRTVQEYPNDRWYPLRNKMSMITCHNRMNGPYRKLAVYWLTEQCCNHWWVLLVAFSINAPISIETDQRSRCFFPFHRAVSPQNRSPQFSRVVQCREIFQVITVIKDQSFQRRMYHHYYVHDIFVKKDRIGEINRFQVLSVGQHTEYRRNAWLRIEFHFRNQIQSEKSSFHTFTCIQTTDITKNTVELIDSYIHKSWFLVDRVHRHYFHCVNDWKWDFFCRFVGVACD